MRVNRHTLHLLLVDYSEPDNTCFRWFCSKSGIRLAIEALRGDLNQHAAEKHIRAYIDLDDTEMTKLSNALMKYINSSKISDMGLIDNQMVHALMSECLLTYELDKTSDHDDFRNVVDAYFFALHNELNPSTNNNNNLTSLDIWLQHIIDNPQLYISSTFTSEGADYIFQLLNLSECACQDMSHNRLLNDVRLEAEKLVIEQAKKRHTLSSHTPVKILDLGPGNGLQSFIIILKSFQLGIRNIELTLVEPKYRALLEPESKYMYIYQKDWQENDPIPENYLTSNQDKFYNIVRALSLLAKSFDNANLTISQYRSVQSLKHDQARTSNSYDVIYAIDFVSYDHSGGTAHDDFHALADCLSPQGTAILSNHYSIEQFEVEQNQNEIKLRQIAKTDYQKQEPKDEIFYEYKHSAKSFFKS